MHARDFDLGKLLRPVEPPSFFRDYWEKSPCVIPRGNRKYYSDLFSIGDVDSLISLTSPAPSESDLSVVRTEGGELSSRAILRTPDGIPDIYFLYKAYDEGYTLIVNGLHRRWGPIATLCSKLEGELHQRVGANLYFTPRHAQGFLPHFDTHDVFVLQLEGAKVWRLYDVSVPLPLEESHKSVSKDEIGSPKREVVLDAGDLLYIPRGHVHEALTSDASSLHLTVGIHVLRWTELVKDALMLAAEDDVRFRETVPIGFLNSGGAIELLKTRLYELLEALAEGSHGEEAIRRFSEHFYKGGSPAPDGHFVSIDQAHGISTDTVVRRRAGMICSIYNAEGSVGIRFPGNMVSGPAPIEQALHFIAETEEFAVRNLPDILTDNAKRVLVSRLVREGLLAIR